MEWKWRMPVGLAAVGTGCLGQNIQAGTVVASEMLLPIFSALGRKKLGDYLVNTLIVSIFAYSFKIEDIKIQRIFGPV